MNPQGRRLDKDEKEFLEKILNELAILREQIAFLDPADGAEKQYHESVGGMTSRM